MLRRGDPRSDEPLVCPHWIMLRIGAPDGLISQEFRNFGGAPERDPHPRVQRRDEGGQGPFLPWPLTLPGTETGFQRRA
jgi:hypothetical protein